MIRVSRLSGEPFGLNPDLIQRVEETPDTVLTLVDGTKLLIAESVAEVIERVVEFRASVLSQIAPLRPVGPRHEPTLRLVEHRVADRAAPGHLDEELAADASWDES